MNLKVIYVVIGQPDDIYVAQALVSIWSLKYYNPDITIEIVTDTETKEVVQEYIEIQERVDDIIVKDFQPNVSNFERSRILKTTLRDIVKGDFLFVDTDTVICAPLPVMDGYKSIAIVEDLHISSFCNHPFKCLIRENMNRLYNVPVPDQAIYYNSGVIFCRDVPESYEFYKRWHENWRLSSKKIHGMFDQQPLLKTIIEKPDIAEPLSPLLNVQMLGSIRYLHKGIILHFFNANWGRDSLHPFWSKHFFKAIRDRKGLSESDKYNILECKNLFSIPSFTIGKEDVAFWTSSSVRYLQNVKKLNWMYKLITLQLRVMNKVICLLGK